MAKRRDYPEFDDLMGVDLSKIDLDDLDLELDDQPNPLWRWLYTMTLAGLGVFMLWLPNSDYYQTNQYGSPWLFPTVCIVATVVGVLLGRILWRWVQDSAVRWAAERALEPEKTREPPTALKRWTILVAVVAGTGFLLFGLSQDQLGGSFTWLWWLAAAAGIATGTVWCRWLLMQQHNPFKGPKRPPVELPPWFKWVTLSMLIGGGLVALLGMQLFSSNDAENMRFSLSGVGFIVGIGAAMWIARRFDEVEAKIRAQSKRRSYIKK